MIEVSWVPFGPAVGTIPVRPLAPVPTPTVKLRVLVLEFQLIEPYVEPFRPSIQSSICLPLTIGTPLALAEAISASFCGMVAESVCMLAVNAP